MNKYLAAIIFTLILLISVLSYSVVVSHRAYQAQADQIKSLTEAQKQAQERLKSDRKVLVAREAKIASQARKLAEAQEGLSQALQGEKTWSDTDVPDSVQKALSGPPGGSDGPSGGVLNSPTDSGGEGSPAPGAAEGVPGALSELP